MTTRAEKRGNRYVINGKKHWITGGGVSRLHLVFARVFDADGTEEGIAAFIAVLEETDGLIVGRREPTMGLRGLPETEILFEDMAVPPDMMVVPPEGLRRGFAGLMNAYNGQSVGAATVTLGLAQGAYDLALDYRQTREQFGRPLCEFQGLQWMLADMSIQIAAARSLVHKAAANGGTGSPDALEAAQAKIFASEMAIGVTNDALQMFGAAGYSRNQPLGAHGAGRPHVHHRRRHRSGSTNGRRLAPARPQAASDPERLPAGVIAAAYSAARAPPIPTFGRRRAGCLARRIFTTSS